MRMLLANLDGSSEQCVFEGGYGFVTFDNGVESPVFFEQPGIHCLSEKMKLKFHLKVSDINLTIRNNRILPLNYLDQKRSL
jgi:hypothetical protein